MILTASDVSSLAASLERWEYAEYGACALVAIGCTGEYIAEFTKWWTGGIQEKKDRLAKRSTLLLISALALELMCLVKTNSISGTLIGSLSDKAGTADAKAQSALETAGKAGEKADAVGKKADDLLKKYESTEGELIALKAKSLPRRLSSEQIELLRSRVARFQKQSISLACANGGKESLDFELDFAKAFDPIGKLKTYLISCDLIVGGGVFPPPLQIEAGTERQGDAEILAKALADIGMNKKDIARKPNENKDFLALTIGPQAQ
ncbi:MAG: hypothetical protein WAL89_17945 [Candidatus Sulfotelmatobacter sp.]|jgi:hypothetical protein